MAAGPDMCTSTPLLLCPLAPVSLPGLNGSERVICLSSRVWYNGPVLLAMSGGTTLPDGCDRTRSATF